MQRRPKSAKAEASIHARVADHIKIKWPFVVFHTDYAAGLKMTIGQSAQNKRLQSGRGYPDLTILEPVNGLHGLLIELKREDVYLYARRTGSKVREGDYKVRKAGDWANRHYEEQAAMLLELLKRGYYATFACGYDEAAGIVDKYLSGGIHTKHRFELVQEYEMVFENYKIDTNNNEEVF